MNLALISTMERPMLEQAWKTHLPNVPIPNLNLRTLRSALAYKLQIKETRDISKKTAQILRGFLPDVSLVSKTPGRPTGPHQQHHKEVVHKTANAHQRHGFGSAVERPQVPG